MKKHLRSKCTKTGGVYLGFRTLRGRKFPYGNFRTSVFCEVRTQIVGKTKFFDSLRALLIRERPFAYLLAELAADFHVLYDFLDRALKA